MLYTMGRESGFSHREAVMKEAGQLQITAFQSPGSHVRYLINVCDSELSQTGHWPPNSQNHPKAFYFPIYI